MRRKMWLILIAGIILRVFLASITFHPDLQAYDIAGQILSRGNIINFYDYLYSLPKNDLILKSYPPIIFNYPPLTYFFLGGSSIIFTSLTSSNIHSGFLLNISSVLGNWFLYLHLLALKLPYFIFDLGCAFLLFKLFKESKNKLIAFMLWMFNPVNLYATYMMGQHDIIPTFFVLLALYFSGFKEGSNMKMIILAAISLGIGASFKIYPFLFLIPLAALVKSWVSRFIIIITGLIPYLIMILPFLSSPGFRMNALAANQLSKSFYAQIPVSGGEGIILFLGSLIFLYFIFLHRLSEGQDLWQQLFLVILLFFIFTHSHPQWFLWITPFLIIEAVNNKFKNLLVTCTIFLSWFILLFFFDQSLTLGLFSPINPQLYQGVDFWHLMGKSVDSNLLRSIFHTLISGSAIYFIYSYFPKKLPGSSN